MDNIYAEAENIGRLIFAEYEDYAQSLYGLIVEQETKNFSRSGPFLQWSQELQDDSQYFEPDWEKWSTGTPTLSRVLTNYEVGIGIIAGEPNHGKSTQIIQMMCDLARCNTDKNIRIVDLSLDDEFGKRYTQMVCNLTGLKYTKIAQAGSMTQDELEVYNKGRDQVMKWVEEARYIPMLPFHTMSKKNKEGLRTFQLTSFQALLTCMGILRKKWPNDYIVIFIDALQDLDFEGDDFTAQAKALKSLHDGCLKYNIMCPCSAHVKKIQHKDLITKNDIFGSKKLEYICKWIAILVNEELDDREDQKLRITRNGIEYPVVRLNITKSKVSEIGQTFCIGLLERGCCRIHPVTPAEWIDYRRRLLEREADRKN